MCVRDRDYLPLSDVILHVWNRGVNRGQIFYRNGDYDFFMKLLLEAHEAFSVTVLAMTLMPNHFHLILRQGAPYAVSLFMKKVCEAYARYLNRRLRRSGPVFSGRYKADMVDDQCGLLRLSHYIHKNPSAAGLVPAPQDWKHSSCNAYTKDCEATMVDRSLILGLVGGIEQYARFLDQYDTGDPGSVEDFLCAEHAAIWREKGPGLVKRRKK